jgi:hypothetical protein
VAVAVETSAEVPSEAKSMGEVVPAPAEAERKAEAPKEAVDQKTAEQAPAAVAPAVELPARTEPAPAVPEPTPVEPKPEEDKVLAFPAPLKEEDTEEPRGLWGGFWRRRTDD